MQKQPRCLPGSTRQVKSWMRWHSPRSSLPSRHRHRRSLPIRPRSRLNLHLSRLNPSSLHQHRRSLPILLLSHLSLRQSRVNLLKHRLRSLHRVPRLRHHSPLRLLRHLPQTLQSLAKHPALNRHRSPHNARKPLSPHRLSLRLPMQHREPTCRKVKGTLLNPAT